MSVASTIKNGVIGDDSVRAGPADRRTIRLAAAASRAASPPSARIQRILSAQSITPRHEAARARGCAQHLCTEHFTITSYLF